MSQRRVPLRPPSPRPHFFRRGGCSCCAEATFLLAAASATSTAWATCVCRACSSIWLDERRMKAKRPEDRRASSPPCPPHAGAKHASSAARTSARILLCLVSSCVAFARKNAIFREYRSRPYMFFTHYNTKNRVFVDMISTRRTCLCVFFFRKVSNPKTIAPLQRIWWGGH